MEFYCKHDSGSTYHRAAQVYFDKDSPIGSRCELEAYTATSLHYHYSCYKTQYYNCKLDEKLVAVFTFYQFEFELDGEPDDVRDYKFTTPPELCA